MDKKPPSMKSTPGSSVGKSSGAAAVHDEDVLCQYSHRTCSQNCLEGYDFCIRHILEDKAAPYKQCAYMTKAGRKCPAAAPKLEKKEAFCLSHNRKSLLARQRLARKRRPGETGETLLEELVALTSAATTSGPTHNEHRRSKMFTDSVASRALEYASSSDSESEVGPVVEQTWQDDGDSDAESIDSDQEDLLKYAGVYTSEEVAQILRDKLIRLQALYIDQFKRLKHMLLVKRRQYLKARGPEREAFGSVKLYKKDMLHRDRYKKLKAMQHYHKKAGKEALLQRQSTERRMQASTDTSGGGPLSPGRSMLGISATPAFPTCSFLDEGILCGARAVPLSKFCQKHILHDSCQLLYRPCPFADSQCGRPVPTLLNTQFCSLHQPVPEMVKLEDNKDGSDISGGQEMVADNLDAKGNLAAPHMASNDPMLEVKQEVKPDTDNLKIGDKYSCSSDPQLPTNLSGSTVTTSSTGTSISDDQQHSDIKMEKEEKKSKAFIPLSAGEVKKDKYVGNEEDGGEGMVVFTLGPEDEEEEKQGR